jgi:hypothetical protein
MPVAIARCGNIYGAGDLNWSRIVPGTIRSLWRGERPIIRSNGLFTRDYIYVEDVADGYLVLGARAAEEGIRGEAFNFSPESRVTVIEIARLIQRLFGREDLEPRILDQAKAEIKDQYLDSRKARARLGWGPDVVARDGADGDDRVVQALPGLDGATAGARGLMKFVATPIEGAYLVEPTPRADDRGFFARVWCRDEFAAHGLNAGVRAVATTR